MTRRRSISRPEQDTSTSMSFEVRVWKIRTYDRAKGKSYGVRWKVGTEVHHAPFATYALADAYRSKLIGFQRKGVAFDLATGLPEPMLKERTSRSWYAHMCSYVDARWKRVAPKSRKSIADSLSTVTNALVKDDPRRPSPAAIRTAVYSWVCVAPAREATDEPPIHLRATVDWLAKHSINMEAFNDQKQGPELTRKALDTIATTIDGKTAAPNTIARKRAVLYNVLSYGIEQGVLRSNPIDHIDWTTPKSVSAIEQHEVISLQQGQKLLEKVGEQGPMGERLVLFFALMMYGALRPAEALNIRRANFVDLPEQGWGEMVLSKSAPRSGVTWSNTGKSREERELKHRAEGESRPVPMAPELIRIVRHHLATYRAGPDGHLIVGPRGGTPDESTYLAIWRLARVAGLTFDEAASLLAWRPYDLRHFALSWWLWAGVSVAQAALWAGNSEEVIWAVYAKVIKGKDAEARKLLERAMLAEMKTASEQD